MEQPPGDPYVQDQAFGAQSTSEHEVVEAPVVAVLAEYDRPDAVLRAAEQVRDKGFKRFDVHTPYPVHGMDQAMGLRDSKVGWIVLVAGLTGCASALLMIWWMNGVDYPLIIGGKPAFAPLSAVPIVFELTVLLSAFGAFFGMLHLNRLPRHHHFVFSSDRFAKASDASFFLHVEAADPAFESDAVASLLSSAGATHVELVREDIRVERPASKVPAGVERS